MALRPLACLWLCSIEIFAQHTPGLARLENKFDLQLRFPENWPEEPRKVVLSPGDLFASFWYPPAQGWGEGAKAFVELNSLQSLPDMRNPAAIKRIFALTRYCDYESAYMDAKVKSRDGVFAHFKTGEMLTDQKSGLTIRHDFRDLEPARVFRGCIWELAWIENDQMLRAAHILTEKHLVRVWIQTQRAKYLASRTRLDEVFSSIKIRHRAEWLSQVGEERALCAGAPPNSEANKQYCEEAAAK